MDRLSASSVLRSSSLTDFSTERAASSNSDFILRSSSSSTSRLISALTSFT
jgi:hypothetical protein